jgi:hypothetical protein
MTNFKLIAKAVFPAYTRYFGYFLNADNSLSDVELYVDVDAANQYVGGSLVKDCDATRAMMKAIEIQELETMPV